MSCFFFFYHLNILWLLKSISSNLTQRTNLKAVVGFPGGSVVKNPPASAGDGFLPWSGKISRAWKQLSPCATTAEPARSTYWSELAFQPVLCNRRGPHRERPAHHDERVAPHCRNYRRACSRKDLAQPKINNKDCLTLYCPQEIKRPKEYFLEDFMTSRL